MCVWCVKHLARCLVYSEHLLDVSYFPPLALTVIFHMWWCMIGKMQDFLVTNITLVLDKISLLISTLVDTVIASVSHFASCSSYFGFFLNLTIHSNFREQLESI